MIQFCVSAPGKVILYGEHAVVYGKTAVAASVDLRTVLKFAEVTQNIEISFPKLDLSLTLSLTKVKDYFFSDSFVYRSEDHELLYHRVQQFVASMNYSTSQQKSSLEALFYSLVCICHEENIELRPFRVHVETQLSLSSGLGSSASFAVCLVSCFLHWSYLQKTCSRSPSTSSKNGFDTADLEKVSRYAFNCERIIHGTPSGIDNSICTYGSMIEFRRGEPIKLISEVPKLNILLVNTKVERSTKALVQRLAELKVKYPGIVDPILDSIDAISREAVRVIDNISKLSNQFSSVEKYKELMTLIGMNQGLLSSLEMSHPSLDRICIEARQFALAAKLTGAGGGGYAFILLPPTTKPETIEKISTTLMSCDFSVIRTSLGCNGVEVCDSA